MRTVTQNEWVWKQGGIGATDAAGILNCSVNSNEYVFAVFAQKVQMRELPAIRAELKREDQMRKVPSLDQGTPEWLQARHGAVNGTEAAGVVGASYRDSKTGSAARRLWEEKTGPLPVGGFENENMKRGKKLEPVVRQKYENLFGWSAEPLCVLHDSHDFIRASLDGLRADDGLLLEIKCPGLPNHEKFKAISLIEDDFLRQCAFTHSFNYYRFQVLHCLNVTGSPHCHFVSYNEEVPGVENQLVVIKLYSEPEEQERLLEREVEFWGFVERRELPPSDWLRPCWRPPMRVVVPE